ncbi:hypothetical protein AAP_03419 [Ascosphaera apis ARSEF 7405]|uniref:Uncharacterized protein n=1 Tax=Ascosphaera apis ARSEF 7405 TaxID=392613 RepID=A0A167YEU3_9EURO|nr:hypothetical protein AAP_03419 [Ascosphaera apis ARSEF 7405]
MPEDPPRNSFEEDRPPLDEILSARPYNGNGPVPPSAFPAARRSNPQSQQSPSKVDDPSAIGTPANTATVRRYSTTLQDATQAMADAQAKTNRLAELQDKLHTQDAQGKMRKLSVLEDSAKEQAEKEKQL